MLLICMIIYFNFYFLHYAVNSTTSGMILLNSVCYIVATHQIGVNLLVKKKKKTCRVLVAHTVILATWQAQIQRITIWGQRGKLFGDSHLQNNQSKMGWRCGSSSRAPALRAWSPEFKSKEPDFFLNQGEAWWFYSVLPWKACILHL
jgi:hypothetical protein